MISEKNALRILDKGDLEAIHGATLEVLQKTGVLVNSREILGFLEKNGLEVDRRRRIVKMSESEVMNAVKSCQRNFRWHARTEKDSFDVVDGRTKFGPGAQCLYYIDPFTEEFRAPTLNDGILICRLLDALDNMSLGYMPVYLPDVPKHASDTVVWIAALVNSSKPAYGGSASEDEFELMLKIAEAILGDREELRKKSLFPGYIDPISPLAHDDAMLKVLLKFPEWNLPVFVTVMALAGATAPAPLAGLLVQQNAEILSSIVISRCATKAPKIVYGSVSCPIDMRHGTAVTGAPEFSLIGLGAVQLAKFYGLPSNMGIQSDSKKVDAQTAYEKMQAAVVAVMAGADFSELFMGSTEAFNAFSPVQMMIDDEIAANVSRMAQGIEVNDGTLSVDAIAKIGPLGNYLKHKDTLMHFRKEHTKSELSDRSSRREWTSAGSKDVKERARERMVQLLDSHVPEPLDPEVRGRLDQILGEQARGYSLEALGKCSY